MIRLQDLRHAARFRPAAGRRSAAWVALGWFWAAVLGLGAVGAVVLQLLGPPAPHPPLAAMAPAAAPPAAAGPTSRPAPRPDRAADIAIPAPVAALLEPVPGSDDTMLPRIGPDGRMPMQAYAARFDAADRRPRVAVLLAGLGMAELDSEEAVRATPPAISLAISPYAPRPAGLLEQAGSAGHETLVSIPMEPLGYPLNDAGNRSLLTGLSPAENHDRLVWALSRIAGYVGATSAMSGLRGDRFSASGQMTTVLEELAGRGLLYIDPLAVPVRPGAPSLARPGRRVADLVIDDPPGRADIEAKLARLEQVARDRGSALGVAGQPAPVTVERLAAWTATLGSRGIALVPVSALVPPPSENAAEPARNPPP
jgi:hypothetical protein